uniref:Pyrimidine 5-nucleotidase n=1 Tax=Lotharella oceanica TaxID=641309 RepID=A0A7S2X8T7_9EUKA
MLFVALKAIALKSAAPPSQSGGDAKAAGGSSKGATLFIDCDDTLYRNDWKVAKMITKNIDDYFTTKLKMPEGKAYELYKKHGTALRGLQQEKVEFDLDDFLKTVHDLPEAKSYIKEDPSLKTMIESIKVDKWVFTASVSEHATRCMKLLGVEGCFTHPIIDVRATEFFTKHHKESYELAMKIAGQTDPSLCYIVDDSWSNIKAAKECGWNTALVGLKSRDGKDATEWPHADHVIADLKDLQKVWPHLFIDATKENGAPATGGVRKRKSSRGKRRKAE